MQRTTRTRHALVVSAKALTALLLAAVAVYVVVPAATRAADANACNRWADRPAAHPPVTIAELVAERSATRVVTVPEFMTAWPREGISLPGVIALPGDHVYSSQSRGWHGLFWHELVHQYQYERDGSWVMIATYLTDFHRGLLHGCSLYAAYEAIDLEREARAVEQELRQGLVGTTHDQLRVIDQLVSTPQPGDILLD